jgi:hypothetical protein
LCFNHVSAKPAAWGSAKASCLEFSQALLRRRIGTFYLLAQKLVFCNSDLDKSTTHIRMLMIYLFLTGVHPTSVHLIGGCLMGVYLTDVHLTGVHLTGVHLTGVHLMA